MSGAAFLELLPPFDAFFVALPTWTGYAMMGVTMWY